MGCACKNKEKKISKLIPKFKKEEYIKKGLIYYFEICGKAILNIISRLLLTILAIVFILPLSCVVFLYKFFIKSDITIRIPRKLITQMKKIDNG